VFRTIQVLSVWVFLSLLLVAVAAASGVPFPATPPTDRQRFGFVANHAPDWAERYDLAQLRAGWFVANSSSCLPAPEGMDRAFLIFLKGLRTETGWDLSSLPALIDAHPHTLWLVGNEPDCIHQDNFLPEEYAAIYHDIYTLIKSRDPTARVSPGGIVQPTPLRLEWLDRVLAAYQSQYGTLMPVDVWNIHNAILNEQQGEWGADIPPGIDATEGVIRDVQDNDRLDLFQQQIWDFRQWMYDNGYGGYPLIITEYGILLPAEIGYNTERVNAYMDATFTWMQTVTDTTLGDPSDGYRLVQRWAWYSLDEPPYDPVLNRGFNGNLFDPETATLTPYGQNFAKHTASFPDLDYVNIHLAAVWSPPTQSITRTVYARIQNRGTLDSGTFTVTLTYNGPQSGVLHQQVNISARSEVLLPFTLTNLQEGGYTVSVETDADNTITEATECDNNASTFLAVPPHVVFLPLISR